MKHPLKQANDTKEVRNAQSVALSEANLAAGGASSEAMTAANKDLRVSIQRSVVLKTLYEDPEQRRLSGEIVKKALAIRSKEDTEKVHLAMKTAARKPERRAKISAAVKARYDNPKEREKASVLMSEIANRPSVSAKKSASLKNYYVNNPEAAKAISRRGQNPDNIARLLAANAVRANDPEFRRKISEANRKRFADPEARRKLSEKIKATLALKRAKK